MFACEHVRVRTRSLANTRALASTMQDENGHVRNEIARIVCDQGQSLAIRRRYHMSLCDILVGVAPRNDKRGNQTLLSK